VKPDEIENGGTQQAPTWSIVPLKRRIDKNRKTPKSETLPIYGIEYEIFSRDGICVAFPPRKGEFHEIDMIEINQRLQ
jgi:hypothetical protein